MNRSFIAQSRLLLLLASGCATTTTTIAPAQLDAVSGSGAGDASSVRKAAAEKLAITRNSKLRFQRLDGSFTPWFASGVIFLNEEGVLVAHEVPLALATSARVEGLGTAAASLLAQTAPLDAAPMRTAEGAFELGVSGAAIASWLDRFILATARFVAPRKKQTEVVMTCFGAGCDDDIDAQNREALQYLRGGHSDAPLGRWSFQILSRDVGPLAGKALFTARDAGPRVADGLRWSDMRSVEVSNPSPGGTVTAIIMGVALGAALGAVVAAESAFAGGHQSARVTDTFAAAGRFLPGASGAEDTPPLAPTLSGSGLQLPGLDRMRPLLPAGDARR